MIKTILTLVLVSFVYLSQAQEMACQVNINSTKIQGSDRAIFNEMQKSIMELINNTKWTSDKYKTEEKIDCSIQIIIDERVSSDQFKGSIQVQSNRPIYKSSYNSPMLNFKDEKLEFKYVQYNNFVYNESGQNPNLVQVLVFYIDIILGFNYDSFSPMGGSVYFSKAQQIVSQMSSAAEPGWKSFESTRNRYWLAENINSPIFKPVREMNYKMHRKGLDMMYDKRDDAIRNIAESLEPLKAVNTQKPSSYLFSIFLGTKADEFVNIFSGEVVPPDIKNKVKQVLSDIDPGNANKYVKITGG